MSRHSPILLKLRVGNIPEKQVKRVWKEMKPAWNKVTDEILLDYKSTLEEKIASIDTPQSLNCVNPTCQNKLHSTERDNNNLGLLL